MRNSFTFFSSYYEAIKELPQEEQGEMYKVIVDYAMTATEPNLSGAKKVIFVLIKPNLDKSIKQFLNGSKNGKSEPAQETNIKPNESQMKANEKPNESQQEANTEPNKNWLSNPIPYPISNSNKELNNKKERKKKKRNGTILEEDELNQLIESTFAKDEEIKYKFKQYASMRVGQGTSKEINTKEVFDYCVARLKKLAKNRGDVLAILDYSINNNYTGLFELKGKPPIGEEVPPYAN